MTDHQIVRGLPRTVLTHVVDESLIEHPAGKATQLIAEAVAAPTGRVRDVLARLEARGLITWQHNAISGRTFRVWPTQAGREALRRGQPPAGFSVRHREVTPLAMPVLGPIERRPFNPDAARERAMEVVS